MGDLAVGARSGHDEPEDERDVINGGSGGSGGSDPGATDPEGSSEDSSEGRSDDRSEGSSGRGRGGHRSFWKELPLLIGIALLLALLIKTFLVQAFSIPSNSMQDTLQTGDRVLVDKLTPWFGSEPERGEVVVFHDPGNWLKGEPTPEPNFVQQALSFIGLMPSAEEKDLIKRVVGVAGDTVECNGTGPLKVNGKALDESSYVSHSFGDFKATPCSDDDLGGQFKVTVPAGKIWVMGDNRQNSLDSRYHQRDPGGGFVPVDNVVGRAIVKAWPIDRWGTLPVPDTFDQPGINTAAAAVPGALGVAGALPLVLWRRRRVSGGGNLGVSGSDSSRLSDGDDSRLSGGGNSRVSGGSTAR
ncbi:signal peptidase I [Streptomyces sp. B-S-A8]|uniref:Signal peptidase I n=1 Tax=Streptomyces solicavernae TaxID=3043614 RepID=A0ABT6RVC8_9ACTN|nr:signal peptidase I [Streptomyces sp. B-S-A8]MDI3388393.1 signal peptidase I [Streptomyces sp. B-S-A8]